jgi:predicted MFS family arabinose efflux permease
MLYFTGAVLMLAFTMIASLVQLITPNDMRGRVMSVYNVAFRGGMPFGSIFTGWLVPMLTAPTVLTINGIALLSLGLYFLLVQRRVAEL